MRENYSTTNYSSKTTHRIRSCVWVGCRRNTTAESPSPQVPSDMTWALVWCTMHACLLLFAEISLATVLSLASINVEKLLKHPTQLHSRLASSSPTWQPAARTTTPTCWTNDSQFLLHDRLKKCLQGLGMKCQSDMMECWRFPPINTVS